MWFAQQLAQHALDRAAATQCTCDGLVRKATKGQWNRARGRYGSLRRILIELPRRDHSHIIGDAGKQFRCQFMLRRRTKSDRISDAVAADRSAFVRPVGWQVQHIARIQYEILLWLEVRQYFEWKVGHQTEVSAILMTDAPTALTLCLQQEHVVAINVRANAALLTRVTDHEIVKTCTRNELEVLLD